MLAQEIKRNKKGEKMITWIGGEGGRGRDGGKGERTSSFLSCPSQERRDGRKGGREGGVPVREHTQGGGKGGGQKRVKTDSR